MHFYFENKSEPFWAETMVGKLSPTPHVHDHIELVLMRDYGQATCYADDTAVLLEPGDLFIAFPNQIHYYINRALPLHYTILFLSPDTCPEFRQVFHTKTPQPPIVKQAVKNPLIATAVQTLEHCVHSTEDYTEPLARGSVLILLSEICKALTLMELPATGMSYAKEIIQYCYQNFDTDISLQAIADSLHISRYYISHLFNRQLHISFNDYIHSLRIRKACELLKSGQQSITEVAYAVGYNSTRSFNRCFAAVKGTTPKAYRALALAKADQKNL